MQWRPGRYSKNEWGLRPTNERSAAITDIPAVVTVSAACASGPGERQDAPKQRPQSNAPQSTTKKHGGFQNEEETCPEHFARPCWARPSCAPSGSEATPVRPGPTRSRSG
ncbi:hypothetical protein Sp245p_24360 (plasmid) [Azospirillum baldaniorum]|uniref:Uncharacterized protein n=1 Tax=Azospirillum baldaniorum TaxID=1064539 RepID=A0A9P1NQW9_9PROT|nr:hypothetical protein Sp245p_24360 [Azospirillum baldaniorum]CCD02454.1 protein of unknown function [Azospirillum baldaniorum]